MLKEWLAWMVAPTALLIGLPAGLTAYAGRQPITPEHCREYRDVLFTSGRLVTVEECSIVGITVREVIRDRFTGALIRRKGR